jgi:O-succinylbenzoic acid--CoA ligase
MITPHAVAVTGSSGDITYGELNKIIGERADCILADRGTGSSPSLGLVVGSAPSLDTLVVVLAVLRLGGRVALFNQRSGAEMVEMQARTANVQLLGSSVLPRQLQDTRTIKSSDLSNETRNAVHQQERSTEDQPVFDEWAQSSTLVIFTSGSEGAPRGVIHSGRTIAAHLKASTAALHLGSDACWLVSLPCCHVGGLLIPLRMWWCGGRCVFPASLQRSALLESLQSYPVISHVSLIPQMVEEMLHLPQGPELLKKCRVILLGGAPLSLLLRKKLLSQQLPVWVGYGASEFCSHITLGPLSAADGGAGYPIEGVNICFDADGRLGVQFPALFLGYCGADENEAGSVYWSSDRGEFAPNNELIILGRIDRIIISGGEKIDPRYIEEVVMKELFAVGRDHRCVVVGIPHPRWGERPVLFVERGDTAKNTSSDWSLWEREIQACIQEIVCHHLSGLLRPEMVIPVPQFPLIGPGKVAIGTLRKQYLPDISNDIRP